MKQVVEDENDFENKQELYSDNFYFDGDIDDTVIAYDKEKSRKLEKEASKLLEKEGAKIIKNVFNKDRLKTKEEKECLEYLEDNLDHSSQVFCKPFFGSDNPDFVVLKEGEKVLLIEVCENNNRDNSLNIVKIYKNNITKIYIPELVEKFNQYNNKGWYLIDHLIYINSRLENYNHENKTLKDFLAPNKYPSDKYRLDSNLKKKFLEFLYEKPFIVSQETRYKNIPQWKDLTRRQKTFSKSEEGKHQKIKGVAGSGKTIVLAKRAVNAQKRTGKRVLILVYNTSIIPHIQKIITEILEGAFDNFNFCIQNYDGFISSQLNNNSMKFDIKNNNDESFFENLNIDFTKYESVFIDEIQDYSQEWINIIKNNFLSKNGEFVLFGDEKQGIYEGEDLKICPEIKRWSNLSGSQTFRLPPQISKLATKFQNYFLKDGYSEIEEISSQETMFNGDISYFEFQKNESIEKLNNKILEVINTDSKNTVILSSGEKILKTINSDLNAKKIKTLTTFFSDEFENSLNVNTQKQKESILGTEKRSLRSKFSMNTGEVKLSTTYSFKGYEAETVLVIIQSWEQNDELIYTAITRAKEKLVILNIGNTRYEKFFQKNSKILIKKPFKFEFYEIQEENLQLREKISEKERSEKSLSRSIKNLESENHEINQKKEEFLKKIDDFEEKIFLLEKEVLEKNKITKFFKGDSNEVKKLKDKIEKLKEEKKELKKNLKLRDQDLERFHEKFNNAVEKEKEFFETELKKEKNKISDNNSSIAVFQLKYALDDAEKQKKRVQELTKEIKKIKNLKSSPDIEDFQEKVSRSISADLANKLEEIIEELIINKGEISVGLGMGKMFYQFEKLYDDKLSKVLTTNIQIIIQLRNKFNHGNKKLLEESIRIRQVESLKKLRKKYDILYRNNDFNESMEEEDYKAFNNLCEKIIKELKKLEK